MIRSRTESLILAQGMDESFVQAFAFTAAGADTIIIYLRMKDPAEIKECIRLFHEKDSTTSDVLVATSLNSVREEACEALGNNIIIYANQLTPIGFPAMQSAARTILEDHRAREYGTLCMSIKGIINLILAA